MEQTVDFKPGEVKEFSVPGIAADGRVLNASVTGREDAVAGDDRLDFQLPDRRWILVLPVDGTQLPPGVTSVLDSLPEVTTEAAEGSNLPVARDVQTRGTSRWLSDYLDSLPENMRRRALRALLPHMGINAVRKTTDTC